MPTEKFAEEEKTPKKVATEILETLPIETSNQFKGFAKKEATHDVLDMLSDELVKLYKEDYDKEPTGADMKWFAKDRVNLFRAIQRVVKNNDLYHITLKGDNTLTIEMKE